MKKIAFLLACLALTPFALAKPQDVRLLFGMTIAGIPIAEVEDTLSFTEDGYSIDSLSVAVGVAKLLNHPGVDRFSVGKVADDGSLLMEDFRDVRGEKVRKVTMDQATGEVNWLSDEGETSNESSEGKMVFDALTVIYMPYVVGALPADGSALMATGRRFYPFDYSVAKQERKLRVRAGEFEVWQKKYINDPQGRMHSIWFAPELGNLPVKISIGGKRGTVVMQLIETSFIAATN